MNVAIERTSIPATGNVRLDHYHLLRLLKNDGMAKVYLPTIAKTLRTMNPYCCGAACGKV